jgi:hypothetical protein
VHHEAGQMEPVGEQPDMRITDRELTNRRRALLAMVFGVVVADPDRVFEPDRPAASCS